MIEWKTRYKDVESDERNILGRWLKTSDSTFVINIMEGITHESRGKLPKVTNLYNRQVYDFLENESDKTCLIDAEELKKIISEIKGGKVNKPESKQHGALIKGLTFKYTKDHPLIIIPKDSKYIYAIAPVIESY